MIHVQPRRGTRGFAQACATQWSRFLSTLRYASLAFPLIAVGAVPADAGNHDPIPVINGEDLAPLSSQWVIASSMAGGIQPTGALIAIKAQDGTTTKLYPAPGSSVETVEGNCHEQVAPTAFAPHGLVLRKDARKEAHLYVANHGGRESIEIFRITDNAGAVPSLHWAGCVILPTGAAANAVAVLADGTIFITNMGRPFDGSAPLSPFGSDVLVWHPDAGWRAVPGSAMKAPNGLLTSADGRHLYVASWTESKIVELSLGDKPGSTDTRRRILKLPFMPDNLRWTDNGAILATGHTISVAAVAECYLSKTRCTKPVPSAVGVIDATSLSLRCSRPVKRSMATVTVDVGDEIWISGARGDNIRREPASILGQECR